MHQGKYPLVLYVLQFDSSSAHFLIIEMDFLPCYSDTDFT